MQPSACEVCRSFGYSFLSFITPTLVCSIGSEILAYGNDYWRVDKALVLQTRTVTTLNNLGHFLPGSHLYLFGCNKIIDLMCGHPWQNHCEFVCLYFSRIIGRLSDLFFAEYRWQNLTPGTITVTWSSPHPSKVGHILTKDVVLRINLKIDDTPVASRSHSETSLSFRLLFLVSHCTDTHM